MSNNTETNSKPKATRAALGETLAELKGEGLPVVAVDADLTGSTTMKKFAQANPEYEKLLFNAGIAEQNMIDVAAGLALTGKVAFTGSFAVFGTGRAYDQIRNTVCYSNLNVKITPTHSGVGVGPDGGTHQMLEDISLMRGLPNMQVLVPADYNAAKAAIRLAAKVPGPIYVRLGRAAVPTIYPDCPNLTLGGANIIQKGADATVVACGVEVSEALAATKFLEKLGINIEIIDAYSIKPLDAKTIINSARKTGAVVVAEEHSIYGGLCSAVSELLAQNLPVPAEFVAVKDKFGKSGSMEELMEFFHIDARAIVEAVKNAIARK